MPLDEAHVEEICADIIEQQRTGVSTSAMFMMKLNPDGTPPVDRAKNQCKIYSKYREILDKAGAKHGILAQATLGHITIPNTPYPFEPSVSLITGEPRVVTCCPLDPSFHEYIKGQMHQLAECHPSIVMLDDDLGLLYKATKGCACRYHMAEFNHRAGVNMTREEIYAHTQGNSEENIKYTKIYVDVQRYGIISAVKAMREGLDEVDPTIQGIVSGIYVSTFCEFSGDTAKAFAGKGNPTAIRLNGGPYSNSSQGRYFTENLYRAAILKECTKADVDIFLAETDTCPQNRYSTSAALMHGHFTASILEGATGAKHWITRLAAYEPSSGKAYRKMLSKHAKFYEKLTEYTKELKPFGCRIPLTTEQNYGFVPSSRGKQLCSWASSVLERFGLPLYFANEGEGAVFLDEFAVKRFNDEQITKMLTGTVVLTGKAADILNKRGFCDQIGVEVCDWDGAAINGEIVNGILLNKQYDVKCLKLCRDGVETLSDVVNIDPVTCERKALFPGVTRFDNPLGGETVVFSGTTDMPFSYTTAFSMLNETRKKQLTEIIARKNSLPVYYCEDGEVYLRAGKLNDGSIFAAFFNLGFDRLEDFTIACDREVKQIEMLCPDGTRKHCHFTSNGKLITVNETLNTLIPIVLFIS